MNIAVARKTLCDTYWLFLLVLAGIFVLELVISAAVGDLHDRNMAGELLKLPAVSHFLRLIVGGDIAEYFTPTGVLTIGMVHPVLLALSWSLLLTICTRVTVAEFERGTADVLFSLPISRTSVYFSTSIVWVSYGIAVAIMPLIGVYVGTHLRPLWEPVEYGRLALLAPNFGAMFFAVGGFSMMVGAFSNRRPVAIGTVLVMLLASVLINFLEQFWDAAKYFARLGLLHYYRPLPVVRAGELAFNDIFALLAFGGLCWIIGWWVFTRRDIPAA